MDYFKKRGNMTSTEVESAGHHNRNDPKVVQSSSEARTAISNTGEDHAVVANNSDDIAADTTLPSAHNGQPSIADVELEGEDDVGHVEDETEEFERTAERVSLWKTKIQKNGVLPSKMVWAPYYRFRNQYFCARLCEISELDHFYQAVVQQPIRENEAVVEFISAPTTMAMDNQLVKAYKDKLIPYYGKGNPDSLGADALQSWDEGYTKKMHKILTEKCTKADAEYIFSQVMQHANEYLKAALEFEQVVERGKQKLPPPRAMSIASGTSSVVASPISTHTLARAHTVGTPGAPPEVLHVGDYIRYASEICSDTMVYARIKGFSGDAQFPLVLNNDASLPARKRVCKLTPLPASVNPLGYDPHSGHFHALCDFVLAAPLLPSSPAKRASAKGRSQPATPAAVLSTPQKQQHHGQARPSSTATKSEAGAEMIAPEAAESTAAAAEGGKAVTSGRKGRGRKGDTEVCEAAVPSDPLSPPPSATTTATATAFSSQKSQKSKYSWLSDDPLVPVRPSKAVDGTDETIQPEPQPPVDSGDHSARKSKRKAGALTTPSGPEHDGNVALTSPQGGDPKEEGQRKSPRTKRTA